MTNALVAERLTAHGADQAAAVIRGACEPLPPPERSDDFAAAFDRYREALPADKRLLIVEGAGHLSEEPGTLDQVVADAMPWFRRHLGRREREL